MNILNAPDFCLNKKIVVCVGAGGVGKTTVASSIAVRAARGGRKVACMTIDPARRLADSLGVTAPDAKTLIDAPHGQLTDITHVLGDQVRAGGKLSFGMLDPGGALAQLVRYHASSHEVADKIIENKLYQYLSGSLSGVQEYMALEQLWALQQNPNVDLIVLDTPPTSNAIEFFTAPRRMIEALGGRIVRLLIRAYNSAGRVGFDFLGKSAAMLLNTISKFTGAELLDDIMVFIDALSDLFGALSKQSEDVEKQLHSEYVTFCLISTPDKATTREAREFRQKLLELGLHVNTVIFNRAHWPAADDPPLDMDESIRKEVMKFNGAWNAECETEQAFTQQIKDDWSELDSIIKIPLLGEEVSRVEALDIIGRYL